jgi:hypothetical protein
MAGDSLRNRPLAIPRTAKVQPRRGRLVGGPRSSITFARGRAPDHDRDGLTKSTDPDHAPYSRSSLTFARSKTLVIVLPINAIRGLKLHPHTPRPVRDPQIP